MNLKGTLLVLAGIAASSAIASNVSIHPEETHQTIRGFGGMVHNIWQGGKGLSAEDAKIAFGTGDGELGLTALRIPVNENSSNWKSDLEAAKLAKSYGAIIYATPWKPPTELQTAYTLNRWGQTYNTTQIVERDWAAYVDHLNDFSAFMKSQGVPLYAISIQNEPDWCDSWTCWTADDLYKFTKNYASGLRKNGTKVISAESFAYSKTLYDKILNDADALKNIDIVGAHFYGSTAATGDDYFQYALADEKAKNRERWMTEHYTESQGSGNMWRGVISTGDQDQTAKLDTVRALDVGYEIHRGLVVGNFNLYTWWYIRRVYGLIMEKDFGGKISVPENEIGKPSKRGYVLSHFSRFVRPGAVRIGATANPEKDVFVSAYKKGDSVIVVLINRDYGSDKNIDISLSGTENIASFEKFVTSETKNVKRENAVSAIGGKFSVSLDKESITTLVGIVLADTVPQEPFGKKPWAIPGKIEAENYDVGGQGVSYFDEDFQNKGGFYRKDRVDIVAVDGADTSKGYAVGYTLAGEWLEYTVNVEKRADYKIFANVASGSETSGLRLSLDGKTISDSVKIPNTGSWDDYSPFEISTANLPAGNHVLKLDITGSYVNIDWMEFREISADTTARILRRGHSASKTPAANAKNFDARGRRISEKVRYQILFFK